MNKGHFSYSDRLAIENMLNDGNSIKEIARDIKRDSSNIIREINRHISFSYPGVYNNQHPCIKWKTCNVRDIDCYLICKNIEYKICPKLIKSPHVCNGCTSKSGCRYVKKYYKSRDAQDDYINKLSNCRTGLHYNDKDYIILIERLCPLIIKTKSVYHSITTINEMLSTHFNLKTIYRQIKCGFLPISSSDLPRSRRKKKTDKDTNYKRDINGYTYEDYLIYKNDNPLACETQMDTVEGIKVENEAVLLTLLFTSSNFLMAFKMEHKNVECVSKVFDYLKDTLGYNMFYDLFKCILTDNGVEFSNPDYIEDNGFESLKSRVFYCDPNRSDQKGKIEVCHEFIRRYIPKGVSFNSYSQEQITEMINHINSVPRDLFKGQSAFSLQYLFTYEQFFDLLGYKLIRYENLILNSDLFKQKDNTI